MILQNPDSSFSQVFSVPYDPSAAATAYNQAAAKLSLDITNATQAITDQVNAALAAETATVAQMLADLQNAITLNPTLSSTIQPILDSVASSYPAVLTAITPASPAQPDPAQPAPAQQVQPS